MYRYISLCLFVFTVHTFMASKMFKVSFTASMVNCDNIVVDDVTEEFASICKREGVTKSGKQRDRNCGIGGRRFERALTLDFGVTPR